MLSHGGWVLGASLGGLHQFYVYHPSTDCLFKSLLPKILTCPPPPSCPASPALGGLSNGFSVPRVEKLRKEDYIQSCHLLCDLEQMPQVSLIMCCVIKP